MADIWKPVQPVRQPTKRELEERAAAEKAKKKTQRPYEGKPGFTIDGDGNLSYDPSQDPKGQAYK